jgi:5,10-methylenetetrahydromethanopterin reductase
VLDHTISIAFQTDKPLTAYGPLAAQAEEYGFDGVTVYNDMLYQPAWLPLLEIARATQRVRIGAAAVNPFTCHPVNIAANIALIDEASAGRAYLGMARGSWLDFVGVEPARPITALRDAFACVRHLLSQSTEPFASDIFPVAGGDAFRWKIARTDIPCLLGTWGARTLHACIDSVNEVKIGGSANPDVVPNFRELIAGALTQRKTPQRRVDVVIGAVTVVDDDGAAARDLARREVALYLPIVAALDPTMEIDPALLTRLRVAAARYDFDAAARLISDDLLVRFAFAGTPDQIVEQTQALFAAGAGRVEFGTPHGLTSQRGLELLGTRVLPHVRMA